MWGIFFRLRQYWLGSLWIIPTISAILGGLIAIAMVRVDRSLKDHAWFIYQEGTATSILASLLGATITFTGFVFTMLMLVPQFGGSQLSARVLQLTYRDPKLKLVFGSFLGTMIYVFTLMTRTRSGFVPGVSLWLAGCLVLVSVLVFLGFVSHFIQHLRPATAAATVANQGRNVIEQVYRHPFAGATTKDSPGAQIPSDADIRDVRYSGVGGVVLAVSERGLLRTAQLHDCVLILTTGVGDYIAHGAVFAKTAGARECLLEGTLEQFIVLGTERTFEQDPRFALRILVDIAAKALSPAINDPTTAVSVIDRIEDLLILLAQRDLSTGELRDRHGLLRVVLPSPTWDEFLHLAVTEIRQYGQDSIQVMWRLRAMLQDLAGVVPTPYRAPVDVQLRRVNEIVAERFNGEADRAFVPAHTYSNGIGSEIAAI